MNIRKTLQASTFSFMVLKLAEKAVLQLPFIYAGLYRECSTKEAIDNFQRRALYIKIVGTPKASVFSFIIVTLVNKSILHAPITTGV